MRNIKIIVVFVAILFLFPLLPKAQTMRVPNDWRFKTSFFNWRFQDVEEEEEKEVRLVKIVDKGVLLKIVDDLELVEIVGSKDQ